MCVAESLKEIKTKIWRIGIRIFWRFWCHEQVKHYATKVTKISKTKIEMNLTFYQKRYYGYLLWFFSWKEKHIWNSLQIVYQNVCCGVVSFYHKSVQTEGRNFLYHLPFCVPWDRYKCFQICSAYNIGKSRGPFPKLENNHISIFKSRIQPADILQIWL